MWRRYVTFKHIYCFSTNFLILQIIFVQFLITKYFMSFVPKGRANFELWHFLYLNICRYKLLLTPKLSHTAGNYFIRIILKSPLHWHWLRVCLRNETKIVICARAMWAINHSGRVQLYRRAFIFFPLCIKIHKLCVCYAFCLCYVCLPTITIRNTMIDTAGISVVNNIIILSHTCCACMCRELYIETHMLLEVLLHVPKVAPLRMHRHNILQ